MYVIVWSAGWLVGRRGATLGKVLMFCWTDDTDATDDTYNTGWYS